MLMEELKIVYLTDFRDANDAFTGLRAEKVRLLLRCK
jgi:hypothetical protein